MDYNQYFKLKQWIYDTGNEVVMMKMFEEADPFGAKISSWIQHNTSVNTACVLKVAECLERLKPFDAIIAQKNEFYKQQPGECHCLDCLKKVFDTDIAVWAYKFRPEAQQALHNATEILQECPQEQRRFCTAAVSLEQAINKLQMAFFNCKINPRYSHYFTERERGSTPLPKLPNWHNGMPEGD